MFAIPEDCQTDVWFEALKAFIDCVEPGWCKNLQGAKQKEINKLKKYDKTLTLSFLNKSIQKDNNLMDCQPYAKHRFRQNGAVFLYIFWTP